MPNEVQDICCPVGSVCHRTSTTLSDVFCCNSSAPASTCRSTITHPAKCLPHYFECHAELGGGCCPANYECYRTECIPQITLPGEDVDGAHVPVQTIQTAATKIKLGEVARSVMSKQTVFLGFGAPCISIWLLACVGGGDGYALID